MQDIYNTIEENNPKRRQWLLIELDDTISDMIISKKPHAAVTDLFIRDTKQNISLVFIS